MALRGGQLWLGPVFRDTSYHRVGRRPSSALASIRLGSRAALVAFRGYLHVDYRVVVNCMIIPLRRDLVFVVRPETYI